MVRELDKSEIRYAADLAPKFWSEQGLSGSFDPAVFTANWERLMDSGRGAILGLFIGPVAVGFLGMAFGSDINDGALVANELFWYVDSGHRGSGVKLLIRAQGLAKEKGCKRMTMVHLLTPDSERLSSIYPKMGFRPIETHYIKDI